MAGGRPREYERLETAENMLKWALKDDSLNLTGFCAEYMIPSSTILTWSKETTEEGLQFSRAYVLVKDILANRRERRLTEGALHVKAYDLNAKVYDSFLRDEHRANLAYEASLKAQEAEQGTEQQQNMFKDVMNQLSSLRSSSPNTAQSSQSNESKS